MIFKIALYESYNRSIHTLPKDTFTIREIYFPSTIVKCLTQQIHLVRYNGKTCEFQNLIFFNNSYRSRTQYKVRTLRTIGFNHKEFSMYACFKHWKRIIQCIISLTRIFDSSISWPHQPKYETNTNVLEWISGYPTAATRKNN